MPVAGAHPRPVQCVQTGEEEREMSPLLRGFLTIAACLALLAETPAAAQQKSEKEGKPENPRPRITLSARPPVGTAPQRVVLTAELVGGAEDFEEYYCPGIEWDWGDDT